MYKVLDKVIYLGQKAHQIDELCSKAELAASDEVRFFIYAQLFDEYKSLQMDSTLVIANKRTEIANRLNSPMYKFCSDMDVVNLMIVTGMYEEALDLLNSQDRSRFETHEQYATLYHLYHSLYIFMADYSFFDKEKKSSRKLELQYKDSILSILSPDNLGYSLVSISKYNVEKEYDKSYKLVLGTYEANKDNMRLMGMLMHSISDIYND